jgi:glycosyltransferase involved in cell wall biosynthesis
MITAVRDEEQFIARTIESVVTQTVKPLEWIIVDDGSRDKTGEIIAPYIERHPWIRYVDRKDRGHRSKGGGIEAFLEVFPTICSRGWEYLVNLDSDLTFDADYFEQCFEQFRSTPKLGIGGGAVYAQIGGGHWQPEQAPAFHVRGAAKIYRRECWEAIGGLWPGLGWDTVDEVKANQLGWTTRTFPNIKLFHQRQSGSMWGAWGFAVMDGEADYVVGYLPLFFGLKCVRHLVKPPIFIRSMGMLYGYLRCLIRNTPRVSDPDFVRYLRTQQLRRLLGLSTIWR